MCSGSKKTPYPTDSVMEDSEFEKKEGKFGDLSVLLEFSASDDLVGFKTAVEEEGLNIDESSFWYGRRIGSKKMVFEERTPLMIAAMFGSKNVLCYILESAQIDINRASDSDRATALHCAVAGNSAASLDIVRLLLHASADANCLDANGNRPVDLIAPSSSSSFNSRKKIMESLRKGSGNIGEECLLDDLALDNLEGQNDQPILTPPTSKDGIEKKEYPIDLSLPDIKNGIYGTDEFRMYMFKVKPCSRAYSHDWTECPFVHPGENARRRDPRKYHYSCVPCPEFRKGTCRQGDACEYAHGIFECWLHPAQYRTRLCKDETNCARRVCFFAHKPEELRPLYASTGSGLPSPRSFSNGNSSLDFTSISPLGLGSPSLLMPSISRLKTSSSSRDLDLDAELLLLESHRWRQQKLMDEISSLPSPSSWNNSTLASANGELNLFGGVKPTNLDDVFGSLEPVILSNFHEGLPLDSSASQQLRSRYPASLSSSPLRTSSSFGIDPTGSSGTSALNSRAAAFAKRSQSFIDRGTANHLSGFSLINSSANNLNSKIPEWGSPDGKLDWGIQKEELNKLRKSASFGFRSSGSSFTTPSASRLAPTNEPDVSWVQSLVKDGPTMQPRDNMQYQLNSGGSELLPSWVEQLYLEQEQMVA